MSERFTGGQTQCYISSANSAAQSILPAGLFVAIDSWSIEYKANYEVHNEINNPRSVRQQTDQDITVTLTGGEVDSTMQALAAGQSAGFLNKSSTPKYHIRFVANGSDGSADRWAKWCVLDTNKSDSQAGNKTLQKNLQFTAEEVD